MLIYTNAVSPARSDSYSCGQDFEGGHHSYCWVKEFVGLCTSNHLFYNCFIWHNMRGSLSAQFSEVRQCTFFYILYPRLKFTIYARLRYIQTERLMYILRFMRIKRKYVFTRPISLLHQNNFKLRNIVPSSPLSTMIVHLSVKGRSETSQTSKEGGVLPHLPHAIAADRLRNVELQLLKLMWQ